MAAVIDNRYWNTDLTTKNNNGMNDLLGIGTAVSGIAGAVGTGIAASKNLKAVRETNAANAALARLQNDWNLMMWEREKAYNSPSNQLKLLQDAGLNPLFYGSSLGPNATLAPQSANLANQEAPQIDAGAIGSAFSNLSSSLFNAALMKIAEKQIANESRRLDLQEALQNAQYPEIAANTRRTNSAADLLQELLNTEKKIQSRYDAEIDNLQKDGVIKEETAALLKEQTALMAEMTRLILELVTTEKSKLALNYALTGEANEKAKLTHAEMVTINSRRKDELRKLAAEADISEGEALKVVEEIGKIAAETDLIKQLAKYQELITKLENRYGDAERIAKIVALGGAAAKNIAEAVMEFTPQGKAIKTVGKTLEGKGKSNGFDPYKGWDPSNTAANPWLD